jgi:Fe-S oxidoreductase
VAAARRRATRALDRLAPLALRGVPIAVLEPSCWSMLTDDVPHLVPRDPRTHWVAEAVRPFEQVVLELGGPPLRAGARDALVHAHCHARSLGVAGHTRSALELVPGLEVRDSGAGCCGMAGSFGVQHPALSRRIGESALAPAARAAALVVAPGTSCRQQVRELTGRTALHPAEALAWHLAPAAGDP